MKELDAELVIGIAGVGVVGGGLLELLEKNKETIARRTGRKIRVKSLCVRDTAKTRPYLPKDVKLTTNVLDITEDKEIDIFIELMGGIEEPKKAIFSALSNNKSVVTANKALLAEEGAKLFELAAKSSLHLKFEAAVAGGIPIVETLKESLNSNEIVSLMGILNGTSNYILSQMTTENLDFATALKQAQELGFAEAEPSLDIDGFDAAHKLNLLIRLAWGVEYPYKDMLISGIRSVDSMDIKFSREFGYRIKHIGQATLNTQAGSKIEAGLFPALVHERLLLAKVGGAYNAVRVEGNAVGSLFMHGLGAGALPTASAVLADILSITKGNEANNFGYIDQVLEKADIIPSEESIYPYYLRFMVHDRAGVLRDIAGAFAEENVSIAQAIQKAKTDKGVPLIFITHKAPYKAILKSLPKLESLLIEKPVCYRIFS